MFDGQKMDKFRTEGEVVLLVSYQKTSPCSPLHPRECPARPWSRVHVDYAGPFMEKKFLLIIDAHSKWMYIHCVNSATSCDHRQDEVNFRFTSFTRDYSV